ncbi:MAG TPA: LPS export ABC transporter permease LptF [Gammaproteobacteria bacterium]|nr:LPS export ABC transporter permease LptF [Gammaproteobacteria bacterium]
MTLIGRYVLRETFATWLVVTLVLFVILMTNQFAEILDDAAADRLPREAVFAILGLTSLRFFTMLTPIGLFLGIMLALARLNRDSETAALAACGVGPLSLLRPILLLTCLIAVGITWLALVRTPDAAREIEAIRAQAREALELGVLESGKFTTPDSGDTVIYAREVVAAEIRDVFVEHEAQDGLVVIQAERGTRLYDPVDGELSFVFYNGRRYEGSPGTRDFRIVDFDEHGIPVSRDDENDDEIPVETKPTSELLRSSDPLDRAELQARLSAPVSLFALMLLAVPLSRSRPREGRYARLGIGMLIYITYANMLAVARVWFERELVPAWLGLWWVHAALALIGVILLIREAGLFVRPRRVEVPA